MGTDRAGKFIALALFLVLATLRLAAGQTLSNTANFSFPDGGGVVLLPNSGQTINSGYAKVQSTGSAFGLTEVLDFQSSGTLISDTVFPSAPLISNGRMYVKLSGPVTTGVVIANPNNASVTIAYYFSDQAGAISGQNSFIIASNAKIAYFFNQSPFSGAPAAGSFTFSSSAPLSVMGIRLFVSERGDFLITPLPAQSLDSLSGAAVTVPFWVDGTGYTDRIVLINPTDVTISGVLQFLTSPGSGANVTVNGTPGTSFSYSIPGRASAEFLTGGGATLQTGSVRITPANGTTTPAAFGILSYKPAAVTQSEAVFPGGYGGPATRFYVEANNSNMFSGTIVANPSAIVANATFSITDLAGVSLAPPAVVPVAANGMASLLTNQLFPNLPATLQGILRVTTDAISGLVTTGLRFVTNTRGDNLISNVPSVSENAIPDNVLPQVVVGGGYSAKIVAFSQLGATSGGALSFKDSTGAPLFILDITPPTLSVTSPADGAVVSGTIDVTADAADDVGVAGVQFMLDGSPLGPEDISAPYSTSWNTNGVSGGHMLTAVARDAAGNKTTSTAVAVTVSNVVRRLRSQITSQ